MPFSKAKTTSNAETGKDDDNVKDLNSAPVTKASIDLAELQIDNKRLTQIAHRALALAADYKTSLLQNAGKTAEGLPQSAAASMFLFWVKMGSILLRLGDVQRGCGIALRIGLR